MNTFEAVLRAALVVGLIPVWVVLVRRYRAPRPFHLADEEHQTVRMLSLGTAGALLALAGFTFVPASLAVVVAAWVAFAGIRVGSRFHLAAKLRARFVYGPFEADGVYCPTTGRVHRLSPEVGRFLIELGPVVNRSRLKSLPEELSDRPGDADALVRIAERAELARFLRAARDCGCLVLEPDTD